MVVSYRYFRNNLSVPSTGVEQSKKTSSIDCPQMLVRNYHVTLHKIPKERRSEAWNWLDSVRNM